MYEFPPNLDLDFFVGDRITQVCIGLNELRLNFDRSSLTVFSSLEVQLPSKRSIRSDSYPYCSDAVLRLIDSEVVEATAVRPSTLHLVFENRFELRVFNDMTFGECYLVRWKGGEGREDGELVVWGRE